MSNTRREWITDLLAKEAASKAEMQRILSVAEKFNRNLSSGEKARFEEAERDVHEIRERISELQAQVNADEASAPMARKYAPSISGVREPQVYQRGGHSYFRDLYRARQYGDRDALDRLDRNNRMATEKRAISTTTNAGGEFVPPLWLEEEWVRLARPARTTADRCEWNPLPPGTDSINIPKVNTGTATAVQASQNTAIQNTDLTTTSVSSPVITIAGGQTVSLQLMEQSPLNIDEVVLSDLAADYAQKLDVQVLSGSGSSGQLTGILTLSGTTSVAWTQATPALTGAGGLYGVLANAAQQMYSSRYLPPDCLVMHPRRWAWITAQSDSQSRPVVVPIAGGAQNAMGSQTAIAAEGAVGRLQGLDVYLDPSIPTNGGAGTNQDTILMLRSSDLFLWESNLRGEAFQQTYANQMSVFVRLYNYAAFIPGRYPASITKITGTGAVTPTF
ncbi:phage major capsid protein [Streptomyces sp. NPDC056373]|uniref:phage major capsid protein n=1 Tax=Streptomyces sp. NPDC056373 TaxID=3345798 RepID=UPI0035D97103